MLAIVAYFALILQAQSAEPVGGMIVSPLRIEREVKLGSQQTASLTIENLEPTPILVRVTPSPAMVADLDYNFAGRTHDRDATPWLLASPAPLRIEPLGKGVIDLRFAVPRRLALRGPFWVIAGISSDLLLEDGPRPSRVALQVPIVFSAGASPKPDLAFGSPELETDGEAQSFRATVRMGNEGHVVLDAMATVRALGSSRVVWQRRYSDRHIFPNKDRRFSWDIVPALPDGRYLAVADYDLGSRRLRSAQTTFGVSKGRIVDSTDPEFLSIPPVTFTPGSVVETARPRSVRSLSLQISNAADRPVTLVLAVRPVGQTEQGTLDVLDGPLPPGWEAELNRERVTLRPRGTARLRLRLSCTSEAVGERWFAVTASDPERGNAIPEPLFGSLTAEGTGAAALEVEPIGWTPSSGPPTAFRFRLKNTGDLALSPVGQAALFKQGASTGTRLAAPGIVAGGLLPKAEVTAELMLPPKLEPGDYTLVLSYLFGKTADDKPLTASLQSKVTIRESHE